MAQYFAESRRYGPQRTFRFIKKKIAWQKQASPASSLSRRLDMWRKGFKESSYTLYDLEHAPPKAYLPDTARLDTFFINGKLTRNILNDKLLFGTLLKRHLPIPEVKGLIQKGRFCALGEGGSLTELVRLNEQLILKPAGGSRGVGVHHLRYKDGYFIDGRPGAASDMDTLIAQLSDYLVVDFVSQDTYAADICAESTNTLRILTLIDPDTREPFVACAVHRFGTPNSAPVDGWSRGGLVCRCDIDSGRIGPGVRKAEVDRGELKWHRYHPDTGAAIEDVHVPHWREICEGLVAAVRAFPFLTYVGWDVVATNDGFKVIEGNNNTDIEIQLGGGMLDQPSVRRFYEYHRVI